MRFDWHERKSARNLRERGFDFEFATLILDSPTVGREDDRREYGERRVVALGIADDVPLTVVYTGRVEAGEVVRRVVSARVSSRHERQAYLKTISRT